MMRRYLIWFMIGLTIALVSSVEYNQRCTFSSDTCNWSIGRRWQVQKLDDDIDDQVLIAMDRSTQDKEIGFTDVVTSSWLYLTAACSFDIRLTFQFSIENEQDQIEVFLIKKDGSPISSIGQWKALTNRNALEDIESLWQQTNITFKAAEEFRIEIEIRHLPDNKVDSTTWFALDDILIETCSNAQTTTTTTTTTTVQTTTITSSYLNLSNSSTISDPFFRLHWKSNNTFEESISPRFTLFTFILYTAGALIALTLVTILLVIVIFTYRKHCLPSSTSSLPILDHRHHSSRRKRHDHSGIHNNHIDQDARTERTVVTTIRP